MEKKILQWSTACMCGLTILVCISLYYLPTLKEEWVLAAEMTADASGQGTSIEIENAEAEKDELNIELPENIDGKDISVTNDILHQTIYVRFAQGVDNYSDNYSVRGSSNHIANISYYKEGEAGVLEISLDKVCEMSYSYKEGYLCMNIVDPHDIYDKIIVVDAGHGGSMPGAVKKGVREKDINLAIVEKIKEVFDEAGDENIKVYYTRLDDANVSLTERVELANKSNADLFISIHNNASSSGMFTSENGTLVLYSSEDEDELTSRRFAQLCLHNVNDSVGSRNAGIVNGDNIYIVRTSKVPVALIEVGYMTNQTELDNLTNPEYQRKVAEGVYNAVMQAFEEGY